jgi:ferredoxin-NADP reductase
VHDVLAEGDAVRVRGPRNHFPLVAARRYVFVAGGIGITPILPMLAAAERAGTDWTLAYGGRSRTSMAFADDLRETYGERVRLCPQDECGLLDLPAMLGEPAENTFVYCCGPTALLDAVQRHCAAWPAGALRIERFRPATTTNPVRAEPFEVELAASGLTLSVPPDRSILDAVRGAGVQVLSSCQEGTCGTCETPVLRGLVDHRDSLLSEQERAAGDTMLICVSRAACPKLVLDL